MSSVLRLLALAALCHALHVYVRDKRVYGGDESIVGKCNELNNCQENDEDCNSDFNNMCDRFPQARGDDDDAADAGFGMTDKTFECTKNCIGNLKDCFGAWFSNRNENQCDCSQATGDDKRKCTENCAWNCVHCQDDCNDENYGETECESFCKKNSHDKCVHKNKKLCENDSNRDSEDDRTCEQVAEDECEDVKAGSDSEHDFEFLQHEAHMFDDEFDQGDERVF